MINFIKDFIKNTWLVFVFIAVIAWVNHYHGEDIPFQLKVLGFLVLLGFAAVYDKLTKIQTDPRVRVAVQVTVRLRDDSLECEILNKVIIFSVLPRIGDHIFDFGADVGKVVGVNLMGIGKDVEGPPDASVLCEEEVYSVEDLQHSVAFLKKFGWR